MWSCSRHQTCERIILALSSPLKRRPLPPVPYFCLFSPGVSLLPLSFPILPPSCSSPLLSHIQGFSEMLKLAASISAPSAGTRGLRAGKSRWIKDFIKSCAHARAHTHSQARAVCMHTRGSFSFVRSLFWLTSSTESLRCTNKPALKWRNTGQAFWPTSFRVSLS